MAELSPVSPELVDSHCHLHMLGLDGDDPAEVLALAEAAGVGHFLNVAVDIESAPMLRAMSRRFPQVSVSVGVHPSGQGSDPSVDRLVELAAAAEFVAVGETGLDYVYNQGDLEWQRQRFRRHIQAARIVQKPLIVHSRGAPQDTLRILREEGADRVGGVLHCFTEDWATAQACMELDFDVSLSGIVTFRNADRLREVARRLPLERLLIETDAPYLTPVPHRGKPNRPAYVRDIAQYLAQLRQCDYWELAQATSTNFFRRFPLAVHTA